VEGEGGLGRQQRLNLRPEEQGHGSLRPTFARVRAVEIRGVFSRRASRKESWVVTRTEPMNFGNKASPSFSTSLARKSLGKVTLLPAMFEGVAPTVHGVRGHLGTTEALREARRLLARPQAALLVPLGLCTRVRG
jgi:hypothetical protein